MRVRGVAQLPAAATSGRQHLRSITTGTLLVSCARITTGPRSFAVNESVTWNSLPPMHQTWHRTTSCGHWRRICSQSTARRRGGFFRDSVVGYIHRVSKNCAKLFLSELRQISTSFDNFGRKMAKRLELCEVHSLSTSSILHHHTIPC